jgi:hypothetical protein
VTTFEARFHSDCVHCGWRIKPGDLAKYGHHDYVVHVVCPEAVPLRAVGEVCGRCFIEKSASGACGCEGGDE